MQITDLQINKDTGFENALCYVDFSSANHEAILIKAAKMGITDSPLNFISHFPKDKTFQMATGDSTQKKKI